MSDWVLSEEQVKKILNTEPIKLKELGAFSNIKLSEEERVKQAKKILGSRKEK